MSLQNLTPASRDEATEVFVEAFRDYPYMVHILDQSGERYEDHLGVLTRFILDARWARRHPVLGVRSGGNLVAAATVVDPGPHPPLPAIEALFDQLAVDLGERTCRRMAAFDEAAHIGRPDAPFHYLGMLGVLPTVQGGGHGKALVEEVKRSVLEDPRSTGLCLNTETESNVGLYEHLGFSVVGEAEIEDLHTRCMFWPRPSGAT